MFCKESLRNIQTACCEFFCLFIDICLILQKGLEYQKKELQPIKLKPSRLPVHIHVYMQYVWNYYSSSIIMN